MVARYRFRTETYREKDDLVQNGIISQRTYDGIKDKIVARQK